MGCCSTRKETDIKVEETVIIPFEQRLGLFKHKYKDLVSSFSNTEASYISYKTLKAVYRSLSLPFKEFSDFYNTFERTNSQVLKSQKFSYYKLHSLFLLLSNDEFKIKLKYWVWLYEPKNKSLSKTKINEMLENLVKVSVDYICGHLSSADKQNTELVNYQRLIKTGKHFVIDELSHKVRGEKTVIEIDEFINNCMKFCGRGLFTPAYIRDKSYLYGIRCQNRNNDAKLQKVKSKIPSLIIEEQLEPKKPSEQKKHFHKKTNSTVTDNKIALFSLESTRNLKENFRYAESQSSSPVRNEENKKVKNFREDFYTDRGELRKKLTQISENPFGVQVIDILNDEDNEEMDCDSAVFRPSLELGYQSQRVKTKKFNFGEIK